MDNYDSTDEAMGEALYQMMMSRTDEENDADDKRDIGREMMEKEKARAQELSKLSKEEDALLTELCSFFDIDRTKGNEIKEVFRAREIIEELSMNVNFPVLPYGETFLSSSVGHSIEMMQMLIEKGADVNLENEMLSETALDVLLEQEDDSSDGELSDEKKQMKKLLLSKGATTAEERWNERAEWARNRNKSA